MRTITKQMQARLEAQAEEAKTLKLTKLANHISELKTDVRENSESYSYTHDQMLDDVEKALWAGALRAADYYGTPFDALKVQGVIDKMAVELANEIRVVVGNEGGVGPYESLVPGEQREQVLFELEVADD